MRLGHISKANIETAFECGEPLSACFGVQRMYRCIEGAFQTEGVWESRAGFGLRAGSALRASSALGQIQARFVEDQRIARSQRRPQFPVVISKRPHPIPSRTRKLSSSEPMVLHG